VQQNVYFLYIQYYITNFNNNKKNIFEHIKSILFLISYNDLMTQYKLVPRIRLEGIYYYLFIIKN